MILHTVTITGADDEVDPAALVALSREFPFVEWGILMSFNDTKRPRFPSYDWKLRFGAEMEKETRVAIHICGEAAQKLIRGEVCGWILEEEKEEHVFVPQRVQLNGFSSEWWPMPRVVPTARSVEWIMQVQDAAALGRAEKIHKDHPNVSVLWDPSGGRGLKCDFSRVPSRSAPGIRMGYAGGIGPDNIEEVLTQISDNFGGPTWIDMESGVRTDNHFDLEKVRTVLEKAAPIVRYE